MYVKDSLLMAGLVLMKRSLYGNLFKILSGLILWNLYDLIHQVGESDCLETIHFVFNTNHVSARQLARCTGNLISMKAVCRTLVSHTRLLWTNACDCMRYSEAWKFATTCLSWIIVKTVFTDQFGLKLSKYKVKFFEIFEGIFRAESLCQIS